MLLRYVLRLKLRRLALKVFIALSSTDWKIDDAAEDADGVAAATDAEDEEVDAVAAAPGAVCARCAATKRAKSDALLAVTSSTAEAAPEVGVSRSL